MDINQFIQSAAEGNVVQAKEILNNVLSAKAFEALDSKKQEIAKGLYGDTPEEEVEVQDTADTPIKQE